MVLSTDGSSVCLFRPLSIATDMAMNWSALSREGGRWIRQLNGCAMQCYVFLMLTIVEKAERHRTWLGKCMKCRYSS